MRAHREAESDVTPLRSLSLDFAALVGAIIDQLVNTDAVHFAPIEEVTSSAGSRPVASCVPEKHRPVFVGSAHVSQRLSIVFSEP